MLKERDAHGGAAPDRHQTLNRVQGRIQVRLAWRHHADNGPNQSVGSRSEVADIRRRRGYAPGARYATDFLHAASISSGVINGIVDSRTAPDALTARLSARPDVASGRSLMM